LAKAALPLQVGSGPRGPSRRQPLDVRRPRFASADDGQTAQIRRSVLRGRAPIDATERWQKAQAGPAERHVGSADATQNARLRAPVLSAPERRIGGTPLRSRRPAPNARSGEAGFDPGARRSGSGLLTERCGNSRFVLTKREVERFQLAPETLDELAHHRPPAAPALLKQSLHLRSNTTPARGTSP
jgi:hypothetical protein